MTWYFDCTHCWDSDTALGTRWGRRIPVKGKDNQFPQRISSEESLSLGEEPLKALDSRSGSEEVLEESILA